MPARVDLRARALGICLIALLPAHAAESDPPPSRWTARSVRGKLEVTVAPQTGPPRIGVFQPWVVSLRDVEGKAVHPARIAIDGGMPAHGHGLPTQPRVTRHLGNGEYLVEGVRFNMAGAWVWRLRIETPEGRDDVTLDLLIDY